MEKWLLNLNIGTPIPLPELGATLHQPTIKEISFLGETHFLSIVKIVTSTKYQILKPLIDSGDLDESTLIELSDFQVIMMALEELRSNKTNQTLHTVVENFFSLFFKDCRSVSIGQGNIYITYADEYVVTIHQGNFDIVAKALKFILITDTLFPPEEEREYKPANSKAAEIAAKLMKGKKKVEAIKQKETGATSLFGEWISILSVGLSMNYEDLTKLTIPQLYNMYQRLMTKIAWDLDIQVKIAGGSSENKKDAIMWTESLYKINKHNKEE